MPRWTVRTCYFMDPIMRFSLEQESQHRFYVLSGSGSVLYLFVCLFCFRLKRFLIVSLVKAHILLFKILFILSLSRLSDRIFSLSIFARMCARVCICTWGMCMYKPGFEVRHHHWLFLYLIQWGSASQPIPVAIRVTYDTSQLAL